MTDYSIPSPATLASATQEATRWIGHAVQVRRALLTWPDRKDWLPWEVWKSGRLVAEPLALAEPDFRVATAILQLRAASQGLTRLRDPAVAIRFAGILNEGALLGVEGSPCESAHMAVVGLADLAYEIISEWIPPRVIAPVEKDLADLCSAEGHIRIEQARWLEGITGHLEYLCVWKAESFTKEEAVAYSDRYEDAVQALCEAAAACFMLRTGYYQKALAIVSAAEPLFTPVRREGGVALRHLESLVASRRLRRKRKGQNGVLKAARRNAWQTEPGSEAVPPRPTAGYCLVRPSTIRWKGEFQVEPRFWHLLQLIIEFNGGPVSYETVAAEILNRPSYADKTMENLRTGLNKALRSVSFPWGVRVKCGYFERTDDAP